MYAQECPPMEENEPNNAYGSYDQQNQMGYNGINEEEGQGHTQ